MIPYVYNIKIENISYIFEKYNLSDENIAFLTKMADEGLLQEAIDILVNEFILPPSVYYQDVISQYIQYSEAGILKEKDKNKLIRNTAILTTGLIALLNSNFSKFIKDIYSGYIFKKNGLDDSKIQKAITDETVNNFNEKLTNALAQTQYFSANSIRTLQRELLSEDLNIKNSGIKGDELEREMERFYKSMREKYPQIYKAMESNNILITKNYTTEGGTVRHDRVDYYTELLARTTLLNSDRNSAEVMAIANGEPAVEYILADPRNVVKEREICQHILNTKTMGRSILALNEDVAKAFGVMTVDEAKGTPDYSMGPFCRHTIARLEPEYLNALKEEMV